ncbi:nuclear transport factor 2 family protein [Mycobacterium sp. NAZ190054]|uniref:nuclear transport factor 2 family protein n=1 Tax=Mycobacterium sp. NAZ190054 TaxID=1747766 RepID=UPI0009EB75E5
MYEQIGRIVDQKLAAEDHVALTELVAELAWRQDHRDVDGLFELLAPDPQICTSAGSYNGPAEVRAWCDRLATLTSVTRHSCSNLRFAAEGPGEASGTVLVTAYRHTEGTAESTLPFVVAEYADRYTRTDAGWRLRSRSVHRVFTAEG